ncbi:MAG: OmpA family protein [Lunatimonas sp.]|uniref:OmpA family protein n=1 Tax=Lunatimonas sp. TaxID=2060141 RepID=UPI00263AA24B|nr:OmpA family protein [Lunatimonas sp.]MCC5939315.1 OmpA family protein [Lunatimonas sp.]
MNYTILKRAALGVMAMLFMHPAFTQLDPYNYRLGLGVGYTNYYGDLSPYRVSEFRNLRRLFEYNPSYIHQASYAFSLEKRLSSSVGLMLQAGRYDMSMSDRYVNKDGVPQTQLPNYNRSLNFRTELHDLGLALVFRTDNDRLLNKNAFMAPYLTLGIGISRFDVRGDLLDDEGNRYDYSQPNVTPNGVFETSLREIGTERDDAYSPTAIYYGLGLGIRFRLAKQLEFFVQSDFRHSSSDYLDDVSGRYRTSYDDDFQYYAALPGTNFPDAENPYRGDPNSANDWYIFHQAGLKFSFRPSKQAFRASKVSPSRSMLQSQTAATTKANIPSDSTELDPLPGVAGDQFFNFFQVNPPRTEDAAFRQKVVYLDQKIEVLEARQQLDLVDRQLNRLEVQIDSLNLIATDLLALEAPGEAERQRLREVSEEQQRLSRDYGALNLRREQSRSELVAAENRLDSLRIQERTSSATSSTSTLDTLVFIRGFQQFSEQVARAMNQPQNWQQLPNNFGYTPSYEPFGTEAMEQRGFTDYPVGSFTQPPGSTTYWTGVPDEQRTYTYPESGQRVIRENNRIRYRQRTEVTTPRQQAIQNPQQPFYPYSAAPSAGVPTQGATVFAPALVPVPGSRSEGQNEAPGTSDVAGNAEALPSASPTDGLITASPAASAGQAGMIVRDTVIIDKKVVIGFPVSKKEVFFETNRAELTAAEKEKLREVADLLANQANYFVALTGFSDNTGRISYNLALAERRVVHVREELIKTHGISPDRIALKPGGLLVRDSRGGSRSEDRKVEIMIEVVVE